MTKPEGREKNPFAARRAEFSGWTMDRAERIEKTMQYAAVPAPKPT